MSVLPPGQKNQKKTCTTTNTKHGMKQILGILLKIGEQDQVQLLFVCAKFENTPANRTKVRGLISISMNTLCDS